MNLRSVLHNHWGNTSVVLLLSIGLLCTIFVGISCQKEPKEKEPVVQIDWIRASKLILRHGTQDIDGFVLDKLRTHRIVMLGDGGHHQALFMQRVISVLNRWMDAVTASEENAHTSPLPRRLVLILEIGEDYTEHVKSFLASGDVNELFRPPYFSQFSVPDVEFYHDVRILSQRIASLNKRLPLDTQLSLDILFPEKDIDLTHWTIQEREDFFVKVRDEHSSSEIINYLEGHPKTKAIIFYGNSHLKKGKVLKTNPPKSAEPRYGHFIAHYLKERFGSLTGCCTIRQWGFVYPGLDVPVPIALDLDFFRGGANPYSFDPDLWDAVIYYRESLPALHLVAGVPSLNIFKTLIAHYERFLYENALFCMRQKALSESLLYFFFGEEVPRYLLSQYERREVEDQVEDQELAKWKNWLSSYQRDGVAAVVDLSYFDPFLRSLEKAEEPQDILYRWYSSIQTFAPELAQFSSTNPKEWKTYLQKRREEIVIPKLIDFLWVGTPEEKESARTALREETDQNFQTAKEWTLWWRGREKASSQSRAIRETGPSLGGDRSTR